MALEVKLRKWGNSLGIILPKDFLEKKKIKENEKILVEVVKEADLSVVFKSVKKRAMSGQEFKEMVRKGWK